MSLKLRPIVFATAMLGALVAATPSFAVFLTVPLLGDIEHPDFDPFHILAPAPAPEAPKPAKHHHHHHMKKS